MPYINGVYYDPNLIREFYRTLKFTGFRTINIERKEVLDLIVLKCKNIFSHSSDVWLPQMCNLSYNLCQNEVMFSNLNSDDKLYIYINLIDPELKFLEAYESSNTKEELKANCLLNFHYFDSKIFYFERIYNDYFKIYEQDDLWARDSIKRARIPKGN